MGQFSRKLSQLYGTVSEKIALRYIWDRFREKGPSAYYKICYKNALWRVITAKIICRITSVLGGVFFLATLAHVNFVPNFFFLEGGWGGGGGVGGMIVPVPIIS